MDKDLLYSILPEVTKPTRYIGNEWNSVHKDHSEVSLKVALAFPDIYEVGMSHIGLKILYHLINKNSDWLAERVYAPWTDMEDKMREYNIPLFALESLKPVKEFDVLGFTLQYELSYTNILNMLDLAEIPILHKDRKASDPLIIAGGPCAFNPEPLADFIDAFYIGEVEEMIEPLLRVIEQGKKERWEKEELLYHLAQIDGIYVPSFYDVIYDKIGKVIEVSPNKPDIPKTVVKQVVPDLDKAFFPDKFIVPFMEVIHERIVLEIARGCTRGCRFCQAGMIYRPVREKSIKTLKEQAIKLLDSTGYEEISLASLSTSDYSEIRCLIRDLINEYENLGVGISLPSLRIDSFSIELAKQVQRVRKTGLTFAPEAGTQRMRDIINKGVTEEDLIEAASAAIREGWNSIKLYFMIGLPAETDSDVEGIADLARKVKNICSEVSRERGGRPVNITVSVSNFVPKAHTPFQWVSMNSLDEFQSKQDILKRSVKGKGLTLNWHGAKSSVLEGVFARGDRRLGKVLYKAWQNGAKLDGWSEHFNFDLWMKSFEECGIDYKFYLDFPYNKDDLLPWDHIQTGVSKGYLWNEYEKSLQGEITKDCRFDHCTQCECCPNLKVAIQLTGADQ